MPSQFEVQPKASTPLLVVAVLVTFALTVGPVLQILGSLQPPTDFSDPSYTAVYSALYAMTLIAVGRVGWPLRDRFFLVSAALISLLALSTTWSVIQSLTITASIMIAGTASVGVFLARCFTTRQQVWVLWASSQLGCLASAWALTRDWPVARDLSGQWAGIFYSRNSLAPVAALALLTSAPLLVWYRRRVIGGVIGGAMVVDLILLRGTRSATSVGALLVAAALVCTAIALRRLNVPHRRTSAVVGGTIVALIAVGLAFRGTIASLFGRDQRLGGRFPLWELTIDWISERPWRGFGFRSVWAVAERQEQVVSAQGEPAPYAHNMMLEIGVSAGIAGLVLCCIVLALAWHRSFTRALCAAKSVEAVWPLGLFGFTLVLVSLDGFFDPHRLPVALLICVGLTPRTIRRNP